MTALLTSDLLLKLGLYVGAPLIAGLFIWFNGYNKGQHKEIQRQQEAKEQLEREVKGAKAKSDKLDWERDQHINRISGMQSTLDLLQEWNKRWGVGKPGNEEKKDD